MMKISLDNKNDMNQVFITVLNKIVHRELSNDKASLGPVEFPVRDIYCVDVL